MRIHDIVIKIVKAQQLGGHFTVQGERRSIAGSRAKRVFIDDPVSGLQCDDIVDEAFGVGAKPQSEGRRHGELQVGVSRQKFLFVFFTF